MVSTQNLLDLQGNIFQYRVNHKKGFTPLIDTVHLLVLLLFGGITDKFVGSYEICGGLLR
jgi:hypothetical protein